MADESELIGGISVSLGASDGKLIGDLAEAERLVQQWAKQVATVELRATFKGGSAAGPAGSGQDFASLQRAIEQGFANANARPPVRPQPPARPVYGTAAGTAAAAQTGQTALQRAINAELAKTGEVYDDLTGEVEKITGAHRAQRSAIEASTRSTRQNAEVETATVAKVDTSDLRAEIKALAAALGGLRGAVSEAAPAGGGGGGRGGPRRKNIRDQGIGTEADAGRVYTYDPAVYAREERVAATKASRMRDALATAHVARQARIDEHADQQELARVETMARAKQQAGLISLQDENEALGNAPRPAGPPASVGRTQQNETPEERLRRERDRRDQAFADRANAPRVRPRPSPDVNAVRAAQQRQEQLFDARRGGGVSEEEREQRIQERIAAGRANVTAGTSTGRTSASRIASTLFGTGGRRLEADTRAAAARQELNAANRAALPFERELATIEEDISHATPRVAEGLRKQRDAFKGDPQVVSAFKRQEQAINGVAKATQEYEKLQGGGNIARNLTAIAAGSFAFSAALKAVDIGVQVLGTAVGPTLERLSGFAAVTAAYTDSLSEATRAASGNAQAVTALKLAGSGLAASTAASIQPLIQQRAEVEAGNKGLLDQIESLHVFENLRRSGTQAGITSTTGGLLGTGFGGVPGTGEQIGNLLGQQGGAVRSAQLANKQATSSLAGTPFDPRNLRAFNPLGALGGTGGQRPLSPTASQAAIVAAQKDFASSLELINGQLEKGGDAGAKFAQAADATDSRIEQTAASFDSLSPAMASAIRDNHLYSDGIKSVGDALKSLQAVNAAGLLPDPALLQQQFARQRQANINAADRQQQFSLGTQIPAQQGLAALANPLQPVGTGIVAANAAEQQKIVAGQARSVELQGQLNDYYAQGKQILLDTYKVPAQLVNQVASIGQEIASTQATIRNDQAAYQVAQYNFQLQIAKRSLADIGGLTDKNFGAGQSYLGQLEKENLALSRQGQQLQFNLSQRQINFQTALAGFQAPGVTPEERQARVKEAQIEASFAQKQLDISKQIFGNQVQIVDIGNLRQGADLAKQIGLLVQGRSLTIDTAQAEERLIRLQAVQSKNVAQVGTYVTKVDNLVSLAFSEIQQLELAAGRAMTSVAQQVLSAYGVVIKGLTEQLGGAAQQKTPVFGSGGVDNNPNTPYATGVLGRTTGTTNITIGEAGGEEVAILRSPRAYMGGMGGNITIGSIFGGSVTVRSNEDIDELARKVQRSIGNTAALKGLRGAN